MDPINTNQKPISNTAATHTLIEPLLGNLKQVIEAEQQQLNAGSMDALETFAREKLQILMQLNRFSQAETNHEALNSNKDALEQMRSMLDQNMKALKFRMQAIGEIAETIEAASREAQSDGTYEVRPHRLDS